MTDMDFILGALASIAGGMWQLSLQATALALLCAFGLWAARVKTPAVRHAVWCLIAVIMLTMPWGDLLQSSSPIEVPVGNTVYMVVTAGSTAVPTTSVLQGKACGFGLRGPSGWPDSCGSRPVGRWERFG